MTQNVQLHFSDNAHIIRRFRWEDKGEVSKNRKEIIEKEGCAVEDRGEWMEDKG